MAAVSRIAAVDNRLAQQMPGDTPIVKYFTPFVLNFFASHPCPCPMQQYMHYILFSAYSCQMLSSTMIMSVTVPLCCVIQYPSIVCYSLAGTAP